MINNFALFFSATDEKTPDKQLLQYETVCNNEVCVLSGCPYSGVFQQVQPSQKKRNQTIEFSWGLYCLVVLFLFGVCNLCLGTYRRNRKTMFHCITEVKNQHLSQVHPWHHTQYVFSYFQDVRFQRSPIQMCRTTKWQQIGVLFW